jgi:hypothetical protein
MTHCTGIPDGSGCVACALCAVGVGVSDIVTDCSSSCPVINARLIHPPNLVFFFFSSSLFWIYLFRPRELPGKQRSGRLVPWNEIRVGPVNRFHSFGPYLYQIMSR